jgi:hypothetical protein
MQVGFICDPSRLETAREAMRALRRYSIQASGVTIAENWQSADGDDLNRIVRDLTHVVAMPNTSGLVPDWLVYLLGYCGGKAIPISVVRSEALPRAFSHATIISAEEIENHLISERSIWQQRHRVELAKTRLRGRERDPELPCAAAGDGDLQLIDDLITVGASMDSRDATGVPVLVAAVRSGSESVVQRVLAEGADPNAACGEGGETALCEAASRGHDKIVGILLSHSADPNLRTTSGQTALMLAASQGHTDIVSHLLSAGADATPVDSLGMTAIDYAKLFDRNDAAEAISAVLDL